MYPYPAKQFKKAIKKKKKKMRFLRTCKKKKVVMC
jgi:hypothetical protein